MRREDLVKTISEKAGIASEEKANAVLNQIFFNRAIPSVLKDKVISNIAEGSGVSVLQAQNSMSAVIGKLTEDPALFQLASNQLVAAWINDCDGCNACGAAELQQMLTNPDVQRH